MKDCKCKYIAHNIPENYTGVLTIGQTSIINGNALVMFQKNRMNTWGLFGTTDASGLLFITVTEEDATFFSCHAGEYQIFASKDGAPVKFTNAAGAEVDCIQICFDEPDCDIIENTPFTLIENTESPCKEC